MFIIIIYLPVIKPAIKVPMTGVWNFGWSLPINLKMRPSEAIA